MDAPDGLNELWLELRPSETVTNWEALLSFTAKRSTGPSSRKISFHQNGGGTVRRSCARIETCYPSTACGGDNWPDPSRPDPKDFYVHDNCGLGYQGERCAYYTPRE